MKEREKGGCEGKIGYLTYFFITIARHSGRLKEESNIKFEQQSVKTFREAQGVELYYITTKCSLVVDSIDIIQLVIDMFLFCAIGTPSL